MQHEQTRFLMVDNYIIPLWNWGMTYIMQGGPCSYVLSLPGLWKLHIISVAYCMGFILSVQRLHETILFSMSWRSNLCHSGALKMAVMLHKSAFLLPPTPWFSGSPPADIRPWWITLWTSRRIRFNKEHKKLRLCGKVKCPIISIQW